MVELEDKAKKMEEITGEPIEEGHYKSVIAGMIDLETLKQTAEYQEGGLDKFKRKVMEFVNLVMSGDGRGGDSMDIGRIEDTLKEEWADIEIEEWDNKHEVNGLGGTCFKCGGMESLITVCPNKFKCGVSQLLVAVADAGKSSNGKERHLHLNDHL